MQPALLAFQAVHDSRNVLELSHCNVLLPLEQGLVLVFISANIEGRADQLVQLVASLIVVLQRA